MIVYIGDEATRGGRNEVALDYGAHGRLGLFENVLNPDTETKGRERVAHNPWRCACPTGRPLSMGGGRTTMHTPTGISEGGLGQSA